MAKTKGDKPETIPLELQGGSNLTRIKADVHDIYHKVVKINEKIGELQAQKQAHRETVKALGIPKNAFDHAMRRHNMEADKRAEYDHGFQVTAEAIGSPIDLFTPIDEKSDSNPKSAPKASSAKRPGKGGTAGMTAPKRKPAAKKPKAEMPPTDLAGHEVPDGTIN